MKAKNWQFRGYVPGAEDVEAALHAANVYFSLPEISGRNVAEEVSDAFHAGFNRGIAWALAKQSSKEVIEEELMCREGGSADFKEPINDFTT